MIRIQRVDDWETLVGVPVLRAAAADEGFNHLDRLAADWSAGLFDGGALFVAVDTDDLVAVGGLTPDPYDPALGLLRMRRFYVRPTYRRVGLGRQIADKLIAHAFGERHADRLSVHAGNARAAAFWEALGFTPVTHAHRTHVKRR